jgi:F0F1-type ATP synthase membrane subunit b/b'
MGMKEEFEKLIEKLKMERDEIKLKVHLASMDAKEEFEEAEKKWDQVKVKASEIADDARETSEEYIAKSKIVGEELKETYSRISKRLSK